MIHNCTNSEVNMVGHQIRIHDSYDVVFGVFISSKLIIEGTQRVKFREYNGCSSEDMDKSGFTGKTNFWKDVQDFNWIKQDQSPNFELIL